MLRVSSANCWQKQEMNTPSSVAWQPVRWVSHGQPDLIVYKLARFEDIDKRDIREVIRTMEMLDWPYIVEEAKLLASEIEKPELLIHLAEILKWR